MTAWLVVLTDGRSLPIVSGFDDEGDPVDDLYEATLILFGSTETGYYEIPMSGMVDPTFH